MEGSGRENHAQRFFDRDGDQAGGLVAGLIDDGVGELDRSDPALRGCEEHKTLDDRRGPDLGLAQAQQRKHRAFGVGVVGDDIDDDPTADGFDIDANAVGRGNRWEVEIGDGPDERSFD